MEDKFVNILELLNINIKKSDIEGCHKLGKSNPKTTIVWFVNRKHAREALEKKSELKKIDNVNLNLGSNVALFFNENLTHFNQHLAWKCNLEGAGKIHTSWSSKRVVKWIIAYCMVNKLLISILTLSSTKNKVKIETDKAIHLFSFHRFS